jgi:hypothetical protein
MLAEFLARAPGLLLCATSDNARELARHAAVHEPHVVVIDIAEYLAHEVVFQSTASGGAAARVL